MRYKAVRWIVSANLAEDSNASRGDVNTSREERKLVKVVSAEVSNFGLVAGKRDNGVWN